MKLILYLIYYIVSTLQLYAVLAFIKSIYEKFSFKVFDRISSYVIFGIVNLLISINTGLIKFYQVVPWSFIYINQFFIWGIIFIYVYKRYNRIWYIPIIFDLIYWIMSMTFEYGLILIIPHFVKPEQYMNVEVQLFGATYLMFCFLMSCYFTRFFRNRISTNIHISKTMGGYLIIAPIIILIIYNTAVFNTETHIGLITIIILLSLLFAILLYNWFSKQNYKKEIDFLKVEVENLTIYAQSINDLYLDVRHYKHDIKNILMSFRGAIDGNNLLEVKRIYHEVNSIEPFNNKTYHFLNMIQDIYHLPLKGVLLSKYEQIYQTGMEFKLQILNRIDDIDLNDVTLCRIVGIIFDNAIEAAQSSADKLIIFTAECEKNTIRFGIGNTFSTIPDMEKMFRLDYSTKGKGRGIGLHSLMTIVDGYKNLTLLTYLENNIFTIELSIESTKR